MLAITDENKVLLIEQFRPPLGKTVVEIPAGLAGDISEGETADRSRTTRALEETGYEAAEWRGF